MGFAFQITPDDVLIAARSFGVQLSEARCAELFGDIDADAAESAALDADIEDDDDDATMWNQTAAAHQEIALQLAVMGLIPDQEVASRGGPLMIQELLDRRGGRG